MKDVAQAGGWIKSCSHDVATSMYRHVYGLQRLASDGHHDIPGVPSRSCISTHESYTNSDFHPFRQLSDHCSCPFNGSPLRLLNPVAPSSQSDCSSLKFFIHGC